MSTDISTMLARRFDQICFVVRDLDAAMDYWTRVNGVTAWNVAENLAETQIEKEYYGKPGNFEFSCAYGFAGDTLIELARHDGGDSVYNDWLQERGEGAHHVGFRQKDAAEYDRAVAHYQANGIAKAMGGFFKGPFGNCRWSYWDTRPMIGFFTELYYVDGELDTRMAQLRAGQSVSITS